MIESELEGILTTYQKYKNGVRQNETKYWTMEMSRAIDKAGKFLERRKNEIDCDL